MTNVSMSGISVCDFSRADDTVDMSVSPHRGNMTLDTGREAGDPWLGTWAGLTQTMWALSVSVGCELSRSEHSGSGTHVM